MKESTISNYDITRDAMEKKFLEYDQQTMIEKFDLLHSEEYIFVNLVGREHRIRRDTGRVEYYSEKENAYLHADYLAALTIFDALCYSKPDCRLSGNFVSLNAVKGLVIAAGPGSDMFAQRAARFAGKCPQLAAACEKLGGTPQKVGDVSYKIPLFDFMDVVFQFWDADEEFVAALRILWDENILDYMHYETTFYATSCLLEELTRLVERDV